MFPCDWIELDWAYTFLVGILPRLYSSQAIAINPSCVVVFLYDINFDQQVKVCLTSPRYNYPLVYIYFSILILLLNIIDHSFSLNICSPKLLAGHITWRRAWSCDYVLSGDMGRDVTWFPGLSFTGERARRPFLFSSFHCLGFVMIAGAG